MDGVINISSKASYNLSGFNYPWQHVTSSLWRKYPNPNSSHVKSVDVLSRTIDRKTGDVITDRLIGVEQSAPLWAIKLFNCSSTAFVLERLTVSPQLQRTTARSVNLSLSDYLTCHETITYTPHPANPTLSTLFSQTANITSAGALGWRMAEKKLEEHSVRRFSENAGRGREASIIKEKNHYS
ncbi:MSF1-domain-containing protein [Wallemia mellicola]|nr:MSF1-domain-containing protein [Wallemia mellicola]